MNKSGVVVWVIVLVCIAALVIFVSRSDVHDTPETGGFCGQSQFTACVTDADCVPAGCSSEVCAGIDEVENIITTCEYKECYNADAYGVSCGCVNNECQWATP